MLVAALLDNMMSSDLFILIYLLGYRFLVPHITNDYDAPVLNALTSHVIVQYDPSDKHFEATVENACLGRDSPIFLQFFYLFSIFFLNCF
jgi:hypothetical protein